MDYNARSSFAISKQNIVGQVQKNFGLHGELVVKLWDTFPETINEEPLWIEIDSKGVPLYICSFKSQGTSKAVIVFEDWETEELASELIGKTLYMEMDNDSSDEYLTSLVGWSIYDVATGKSGVISDFNESESNPLLFVEIDSFEHLIPLAEEYIRFIDEDAKKIEVELPEGLLDL